MEIAATCTEGFRSSRPSFCLCGYNSTLPLRHPMGPGWAALSALGFIISTSTRGGASLCPGLSPHRACSAKSPSTSQSILENSPNSLSFREIRVSPSDFGLRSSDLEFAFRFSLFPGFWPFSLQPLAFSLISNVTMTLKMTGMVAGTFYLSKSCVKIADV